MDKSPASEVQLMARHPPAEKAAIHRDTKTALRYALGRFTTGVTIVATDAGDGHVHCMTINSFASLSLDPPLVLWTLRTRSARYATYSGSKIFSVSVLADSQVDLARKHAAPPAGGFAERNWKAFLGGCPVIDGACAHFICKNHTEVTKGDHVILIGEIIEFAEYDHAPLLFMSGKYFSGSSLKPQ
jgi:flavin reductase (DIM6/NTAB) family NADH-FMN oxidoreductase RutF